MKNLKKAFCLSLCLLIATPMLSQALIAHPWQGKRVAYLGDSITDPRNSGSKKKYWGFLEDWLQITPFVYGISGRQWDDIPKQADRLHEEHGDDVDAIIIFCGTNDYNNAVPIGKWFSESDEQVYAARGATKTLQTRRMRQPIMTDSTYRGRINIALAHVKALYPTKQIVLLTPIHRGYFGPNDKNVQPTEAYQNKCGEYVDAYVESLKEAGNIWAVPVIDWNATSGLYPLLPEHLQYFAKPDTDQLHPNDWGHQRMARTLMYQLLTLPCTF
ncbi:MAG: SGNH/GDSL hydrolase family protein [Prevotella sp.]|nr:SGNH/GDSL hydrolase family protein [Prevotella sp.]